MDPKQTLKDILLLALEAAQTVDSEMQSDMLDQLNQHSMDLRDLLKSGGFTPYLSDTEIHGILRELHLVS